MGWESFVARGKIDEAFVGWMMTEKWGGHIEVSTWEEDVRSHVDIWWVADNGRRVGVDVKGLKRRSRSDFNVDDSITWLEFKNVYGENGSLYGAADYIAFRRLHSVVFVNRSKLADYAAAKVQGKPVSQIRPSAFWQLYNRRGRADVICMAPMSEIESVAKFILPNPKLIPVSLQVQM